MRRTDIQKMTKQAKKVATYPIGEHGDYREPWRIFRIMAELVEGYQFLSTLSKEVTIFGSARLGKTSPYYAVAEELGGYLGKAGFTVITGGGPGIMEAANKGASDAHGASIGLNIQLPFEQVLNSHVTKSTSFSYFFTRKVMLTSPANAFVCFPGGFGTMDEFFEVVDLMELKLMPRVPIVLVGKEFWQPLIQFLENQCCPLGSVSRQHIESWQVVDTAYDAFQILKNVSDSSAVCDLSANNFNCQGNINWKIFRIMAELVEGFEFVSGTVNGVTVLGTKSIVADSQYYEAAYELGIALALEQYSVISGGRGGVSKAISKGAFEMGGLSLGIGMKLGDKVDLNPYLTKSILFSFPFTRKLIMTSPSQAFVCFPGGFGTLHQLFEILTLMQTKKISRLPLILYDHNFWSPLHHYIKKILTNRLETISSDDDELYQIVDDPQSFMKILKDYSRF